MMPTNREQKVENLKNHTFDLLVLGGGATGAGIALDATSRGISTALIEKGDFASGTSSKSTKLIHGGLRYLKQLDVQLVRETGTERAILHRLAPHLVLPEKMLMPLIEGGTYGYWSTSFGLKVYDILAKVTGDDKRKMLNKQKCLEKEPLLDPSNLKGGGYYAEYRTDDARLTIELIKTAERHGACSLNYCEGINFVYDDNMVVGVQCRDKESKKQYTIYAKTIVSATGPWVDGLRSKDGSLKNKKLHLTKGIHIVVPHERFPLKQTVYFDVPDGRMIFAIPRGRITYIGTTDTNYTTQLDRVVCTQEDVSYLLNAVNEVFPTISLVMDDVESNWAGLRPLIHQDGKSPSELSRKDEIFESHTGLISIAGGKLTGYRKMAQRIVDLVTKRMDNHSQIAGCKTSNIPLTENPFKDYVEFTKYLQHLEKQLETFNLNPYHAQYLGNTYGRQADEIIHLMNRYPGPSGEETLACAEACFCVKNEFVLRSADFFVRRTGRLFFDLPVIEKVRKEVFSVLAKELKWTTQQQTEEEEALDQWIKDATTYYSEEAMV